MEKTQGVQIHKRRMANMELLRILAMMMVVLLHFLGKGNLLSPLTGGMGINGYVAWFLEAFSIVAVNVYMLISGYFLVESGFKCSRLVQLVLQILFYSLLVPLCLISVGILSVKEISIYQILYYVLPIQMKHYWFGTAYVIMYLFSPFLGIAVHHMEKKQLQLTLGLLLLVLSVGKSVLPVQLEMDSLGYDAIWFLCVYLVAAYIRLHGIPFFKNGRRSIAVYILGCLGIFGMTLLIRGIYLKFDLLERYIQAAYSYNHILNLLAAVALFYAFLYVDIPDGRWSRLICKTAPYTFGVYLLHEQVEIRYLWPLWLGAGTVQNPLLFVLHALVCVIVVFVIGTAVDMVRGLLFRKAGYLFKK